jgi:hypothetical protein
MRNYSQKAFTRLGDQSFFRARRIYMPQIHPLKNVNPTAGWAHWAGWTMISYPSSAGQCLSVWERVVCSESSSVIGGQVISSFSGDSECTRL